MTEVNSFCFVAIEYDSLVFEYDFHSVIDRYICSPTASLAPFSSSRRRCAFLSESPMRTMSEAKRRRVSLRLSMVMPRALLVFHSSCWNVFFLRRGEQLWRDCAALAYLFPNGVLTGTSNSLILVVRCRLRPRVHQFNAARRLAFAAHWEMR